MLEKYKPAVNKALTPILQLLHALHATPNQITTAGILIGIIALITYFFNFALSLVLFTIAFLCDMLDGAYARKYQKTSKFGEFYDALMDRIVEMLFLIMITIYFGERELGLIMIGLSPLVSYSKHVVSGYLKDTSTIFDRAERLIFLTILVVVSFFTSILNRVLMIVFIALNFSALTQLFLRIHKATHSNASR